MEWLQRAHMSWVLTILAFLSDVKRRETHREQIRIADEADKGVGVDVEHSGL